MSACKKAYIAGPWVFRQDYQKFMTDVEAACMAARITPVFPIDNGCTSAQQIAIGNAAKIRRADIIIADINPFRGNEPDSGTCFEIGYAVALSKIVICHQLDTRSQREKYGEADVNGMHIEDFGLPANLMITASPGITVVSGDIFAALRFAASRSSKEPLWGFGQRFARP